MSIHHVGSHPQLRAGTVIIIIVVYYANMAAQRDTIRQVKYRQKQNILYNYKNVIIKAQNKHIQIILN